MAPAGPEYRQYSRDNFDDGVQSWLNFMCEEWTLTMVRVTRIF